MDSCHLGDFAWLVSTYGSECIWTGDQISIRGSILRYFHHDVVLASNFRHFQTCPEIPT